MANGLTINNRSIKAIGALALRRLSDQLLFNWTVPSGFVLNEGIEQKQQTGKNATGETVRLGSYTTSRQPTLTLTYSTMSPEMIAWKMGNYLETGSYTTRFPIQIWVTKGEYAGAASGYRGFGIAEDVNIGVANAPRAATTRGEVSVQLTQMAWDNYSAWRGSLLRFAVGENGALRFSDDIVAAQDVVMVSLPVTEAMSRIGDIVVGDHAIETIVVDSLNQVHYLEIYQATPDLSNSSMDLTADTFELNLFLNNPPGQCRAWNMYSPTTNNSVTCAA